MIFFSNLSRTAVYYLLLPGPGVNTMITRYWYNCFVIAYNCFVIAYNCTTDYKFKPMSMCDNYPSNLCRHNPIHQYGKTEIATEVNNITKSQAQIIVFRR